MAVKDRGEHYRGKVKVADAWGTTFKLYPTIHSGSISQASDPVKCSASLDELSDSSLSAVGFMMSFTCKVNSRFVFLQALESQPSKATLVRGYILLIYHEQHGSMDSSSFSLRYVVGWQETILDVFVLASFDPRNSLRRSSDCNAGRDLTGCKQDP